MAAKRTNTDSEACLRGIVNSIPSSLILIDKNFKIIDYNKSAIKWAKNVYNKRIKKSDPIFKFLPEEHRDHIDKQFRGIPLKQGLINITKNMDDEEFWFEYEFSPVKKNGVNKYLWITIIDITERKFTVDEFVKIERKFTSLVKESSDIISILEGNGIIRYSSNSTEKILGYDPLDIEGKSIFDFIHPKYVKGFKSLFKKSLKEKERHFTSEYLFQHVNGHWIYLEVVGTNLLSDPDVNGFVLNSRDISYRKQIEAVLERINRQREMILESIGDGIYGIDINRKITFINPAAIRMIGKESHNVIGEFDYDVIQYLNHKKKDYPENKNPVLATLNDKSINRVHDGYFQLSNDILLPVEYIVNPIIENENISGVVITFSDISERKIAQEKLHRAKEDAEKANQAKSYFLANISHEIRTPLNSIMGFIQLMGRTSLEKNQLDYLETISESSQNLLEIINDILDFSKIEKNKLDLDITEFNSLKEFETAVNIFSTKAGLKDICFYTFIDPALPETLIGDPLRINQILINLISNALKFTQKNGQILVEIIPISSGKDTMKIRFSVTDNGIGIPEKKKDTIFEPFSQADTSKTRKYDGAGLGLAISYNLVNMMGGKLEFQSEEGIGSRFFFDLSLGITGKATRVDNDLSDKQVLFISSGNELQSNLVKKYSEKYGFKVNIISEINMLHKYDADVIFIDKPYDEINQMLIPGSDPINSPVALITNYKTDIDLEHLQDIFDKIIFSPLTGLKILHSIVDLTTGKNRTQAKITDENKLTGKILVAEDNKNNQKLILLMLKELGLSSDISNNGREALSLYSKNKYSLIIMDINMPICDGIEAMSNIRNIEKNNGKGAIPIIALTAKAAREEKENLISIGFNDYLSKPITMKSLEIVLMKFLEKAPLEDPVEINFNAISDDLGVSIKDVKVLIKDLIDSMEEYIVPLTESVKKNDLKEICQYSHKLKGTTANYKFEKVALLLETMESKSEKEIQIDYSKLLDEIKHEIEFIERMVNA